MKGSVPTVTDISLEDIKFGPVEGNFLPEMPFLIARLGDGQVTLTIREWSNDSTDRGSTTEETVEREAEEPKADPPFWSGPVAQAQFVYE